MVAHRRCILIAVHAIFLGFCSPFSPAGEWNDPGPYSAGWIDAAVERPGGDSFTCAVYYPADWEGFDAPLAASGAPYPVIVFGHGYLQHPDKYREIYHHLASWGFLVLAPESGLGLFPSHADFAEDLRFALDHMEGEQANGSSKFFQAVLLDRFGFSGHSMGAGCSLLAASQEGLRLKGVANLAAADTNPSAVAVMPSLDVPVLLIGGSDDWIAPVSNHQQPMYDQKNAPKLLSVIQGGTHTGFMDGSGGSAGEEQRAITKAMLTAFFQLYLKSDETGWISVWGPEMVEDDRWALQADPGMVLQATRKSQSAKLSPGPLAQARGPVFRFKVPSAVVRHELAITNTSSPPQAFDLFVEHHTWPTAAAPSSTAALDLGQQAKILLWVYPLGFGPASDQALVSARSGRDGLTRHYVRIDSLRD